MPKLQPHANRLLGMLLLLTFTLVLAKAAGRLAWSWWAVTTPLWGPWAALLAVAGGYSIWRLLAARR